MRINKYQRKIIYSNEIVNNREKIGQDLNIIPEKNSYYICVDKTINSVVFLGKFMLRENDMDSKACNKRNSRCDIFINENKRNNPYTMVFLKDYDETFYLVKLTNPDIKKYHPECL